MAEEFFEKKSPKMQCLFYYKLERLYKHKAIFEASFFSVSIQRDFKKKCSIAAK